MGAVLALLGIVLVSACGNTANDDERSRLTIPNLVGLSQSEAECTLKSRGLRWRYGGDATVRTKPTIRCGTRTVITPDPPVVRQGPAPGSKAGVGRVVTLETVCTLRRRTEGLPCG